MEWHFQWLLARHGQCYGNIDQRFNGQRDDKLTPLGIKHAHQLGDFLRIIRPSKMDASDLDRAFNTAQIAAVNAEYDGILDLDERLEEIGAGRLTMMTLDEVKASCIERGLSQFSDLTYSDARYLLVFEGKRELFVQHFGVESIDSLASRVNNYISRRVIPMVRISPQGGTLVSVGHGGTNAYLVEAALHGTTGINIPDNYLQDHDEATLIRFDKQGNVIHDLTITNTKYKELIHVL